jgi:hypothetical protein
MDYGVASTVRKCEWPSCAEKGETSSVRGQGSHRLRPRLRRPEVLSGLALDPNYIEGFVEGCLERIGEDDAEGEDLLRDMWDEDSEKETVLDILKAECEVFPGRPPQS